MIKRLFKNLLLFFVIGLVHITSNIYSQEENEGNWFLKDRAYPLDSIPNAFYKNGLEQQMLLRQAEGYNTPGGQSWISIGPTPYYRNDGIPRTGRVAFVKYDPWDPNIVFVLGHNGGVWKSTDGGHNFRPKTDLLQTQASGCLTFDPTDDTHQTIYYGTGGSVFCFRYNYYGIGVYKSTDLGETWTGPFSNGFPGFINAVRIAIPPYKNSGGVYPDIFLASGDGDSPGLFKSSDGGNNWFRVIGTPVQPCYDVVALANIYAIGTKNFGYWVSTDYGSSFYAPLNTGLDSLISRSQLAIATANPNYVYVVTRAVNHVYAYVSGNWGLNFSYIYDLNDSWLGGNYDCMSQDFLFVWAKSDVSAIAGFGTAHESRGLWNYNGYNNWTNAFFPPTADINNIDYNSDPSHAYAYMLGGDQGLYYYNETNGNWENRNITLSLSEPYRISSNSLNDQDILVGVEDAGFFKFREGTSATWDETNGGADGTQVLHSNYAGSDVVIGNKGADGGSMNFSLDGGTNWRLGASISGGYWDGDEDWIAPIAELPGSNGTFYTPRRRGPDTNSAKIIDIYANSDFNNTWVRNPNSIVPFTTNINTYRYSPQCISFCENHPDVFYISTKNWWIDQDVSQIFRTLNGGQLWQSVITPTLNGFPNRVITWLIADPVNPNEVYMTLSGFDQTTPGKPGHVYKSTNGGTNWFDISVVNPIKPLPNFPANYMIVRYRSAGYKELIVATDAGIYHAVEDENSTNTYVWQDLCFGLPNTPCLGMDLNFSSQKLRAATLGRGVWEVKLQGPIYIPTDKTICNPPGRNYIIIEDSLIVGSGASLTLKEGTTVKMKPDAKIIIEDGGAINCTNGNPITMTSETGTWGGIEFQGNSASILSNCTFQNTATPITIDNSTTFSPGHIDINNCTFTNSGPVVISNRSNVTVSECTWNYSSTIDSTVCGVSVTGSGSVIVQGNTINYAASSNRVTGISLVQSSTTSVTSNTIRNTSIGIFASNSDPSIRFNNIGTTGTTNADIGIGLDNCPNAYILYDTIASYVKGISLTSGSSPVMHDNKVTGCTTDGLYCDNSSNPRLTPTIDNGVVYWDAGLNILETTTNGGDGIYISNYSTPNMAEGYNTVWGGNCYINGTGWGKWSVADNCWVDNPPASKYCVTGFTRLTTTPYSCTPPPGAGGMSGSDGDNTEIVDPPQPLIVDLGNGVYDTLRAVNSTTSVNADLALYYTGTKQALQSNFTDAVNTYKQVIQNYHDSTSAIESMKKIFYCYGRMHADTTAYSDLRNYYLGLASSDTSFTKTASELSRKCLVKKLELENAIGEYENAVQNSNNHSDSVSAEVNIIEVYMLMQNHGGNSRFTGRMGYLKPMNVMDGLRMIKDKLYNLGGKLNNVAVPRTFSLSQNYPNPFNPTTTIKYAVPQPVKVSIKIYDILGRIVKSLVNDEYKEAGFYEVKFDGSNFASGVYFYRIEAGKFIQSKKMVIVK